MINKADLIPAIFIGHGSPILMIEDNPYAIEWEKYLQNFSELKGILSISAHWVTHGVGITTNNPQKIIYDFYGFPQEMYDIQLNIAGSQDIAQYVASLLMNYQPILTNEWGLDHGTWSVIYQVNSHINIPVIQLSINYDLSFRQHFELAQSLCSLREKNILILGSGNLIHNLGYCRNIDNTSQIYPWAKIFQERIISYLKDKNIEGFFDYLESNSPEVALSIASQEHFIPLIYVLAQAREDEFFEIFNQHFAMTALDMTCMAIKK
ncbi:MAG: dioxygenase [Neisseriaceae bacterium]|nr:dioxygenase [Neisseriaceae bacterium]